LGCGDGRERFRDIRSPTQSSYRDGEVKNLFRKNEKYLTIPAETQAREIPENLWVRCNRCGELLYIKEFEKNLKVCHKCDYHFRLSSSERIGLLIDSDTFVEEDGDLLPADPLSFVSLDQPYPMKVAETRAKTGLNEAVVCGFGRLEGEPVQVAVCDFSFLGASMGSVFGEKVTRTLERGLALRQPVVIVSCSGGARMHEGIFSLMQLPKTAGAVAMLAESAIPFLSVLTDPTTGGVSASFATLGDVIMAEPGALIGFAGPRVIEQITKQKLPPGFQTSEFLLEHGMIDMVVHRRDLKPTMGRLLRLYQGAAGYGR
jgi:acetyl-CoA carboxylase carboxyl transferase subunit beta